MNYTKEKWLLANCPICGEKYHYLPEYKPATCNQYSCITKHYHKAQQVLNKAKGK